MREGAAGSAVAAMDAAVDGLLAIDLNVMSDEELLDFTVSLERAVRRVPAVQDAVTAAVDARGVGARAGLLDHGGIAPAAAAAYLG